MPRGILSIALLVVLPAAAAAGPQAAPEGETETRIIDTVVARVGSMPITRREVSVLLEDNPALGRDGALDLLIERRLAVEWARLNGITVTEEEVQEVVRSILTENRLDEDSFQQVLRSRGRSRESFLEDLREQVIASKALRAAMAGRVSVTEEEIRDLYARTYRPGRKYTLSHILIRIPPDAGPSGEEAALSRARRVLDVVSGGVDFAEAAARYSEDAGSAQAGGRLGTFREGELMPALEEALRDLEPGMVTGPVLTDLGYHILRLDGVEQTRPPDLEEVRDELQRRIASEKERAERVRWLDEIREQIRVSVFER